MSKNPVGNPLGPNTPRYESEPSKPDQLREQLDEQFAIFEAQNEEMLAYMKKKHPWLQALLATEYDRGYNAAPDVKGYYISLPEKDWKAALKAEYDRGKVAGQVEEVEAMSKQVYSAKGTKVQDGRGWRDGFSTESAAMMFWLQNRLKELKEGSKDE